MNDPISIFWFRRDLRLDDNVGFLSALKGEHRVMPIFIFDEEILDKLPEDDARVTFIHEKLQAMRNELQENCESSIAIYHGAPENIFKTLISEHKIKKVFTNHDYEPYAKERDEKIKKLLGEHEIDFETFKDQVIFEKEEVVKDDGDPYIVYTPYKNKWKEKFDADQHLTIHYTSQYLSNLIKNTRLPNLSLSDIGFKKSKIEVPDFTVTPTLIQNYEDTRNFPGKDDGTSRLGPHLRFGTVSVRKMVKKAIAEKNEVFWSELIWREFFMQILYHYPHTVHEAFKKKYDRIDWRNKEKEFEKWKKGETGFKLVDAGMRQLNETGYMHNRVRMLVASFLCKHLLIDWRWGEAYFAEKLLDYEMSSNVGNWQWAAGSGVDAAPYFRIFNPMTQVDKFDKKLKYIQEWVPEHDSDKYVEKMVDHKEARERCLKVYKEAVS
ncbi:deoxyribodipyrimidine photo-lyase [Euzebyella marina]|mgnify:CR=1 FL=1|uniref:Deoxyribodipyrimidine photo-lyase n=1 Tax=Euzebyella marina TaxID=1761453 RepID=A0A3G2L807_9FLAO|nr:deoxyribodipyrimidine photo-lyase [Euzebyella marina]AYN68333.1 deoxyribodipyrimidine photo-lyase [Euzebyella marina]MAU72883.1 deoxyribodipyrimidine photolyase [Pseudozobellia sp.]MBG50598.1 deoxyribodipyrimidine photolyase [Pseudozobellia sp.]|tara:strand:+ start:2126 stop:3436 length:1311 start_codon:yes stop_codon:yes gene_type:complete